MQRSAPLQKGQLYMKMQRYDTIDNKNPREIVLLRGSGCKWRRCRFCDYHLDFSHDEKANFEINRKALSRVTGRYGVLEVINSGSFCDLDVDTTDEIIRTCIAGKITQIHIECHWRDRLTLPAIKERFAAAGIQTKVKIGVETFDTSFRDDVLKKGMEHASPAEIAEYADEVCLLFGLAGQTELSMKNDIETGLALFERVCINLMTENSTSVKPDEKVLEIFMCRLFPIYEENTRVDILLENTDFGVGQHFQNTNGGK